MIGMVSILLLISSSPNLFSKTFGTVPRALTIMSIIIIIFLIWEFFTPALADGFPLESGWQLVLVPLLWWLFRARQLQLVLPSLSCSKVFFGSLARSKYLTLFSLSFSFTLWSAGTAKSAIRQVLFFLLLTITIIILALSAGAAEYTDRFSEENLDLPNECPGMILNNLIMRIR